MLTNENLTEKQNQQVKKELSGETINCIVEIMLNYYNLVEKTSCGK